MYKKGSMAALFIVALAALGLMTFISFTSDVTGDFSDSSLNKIRMPSFGHASSYVINQQPQTTGSDVARVQLQCYIWKYDHPNVQAPAEIAGLCASFGVAV